MTDLGRTAQEVGPGTAPFFVAREPDFPQQTARRKRGLSPSGSAWWLVLPAVLGAAAALLLWWLDPRQLALPLCAFHQVTGLHCPGCGAIRATHELLHGRLLTALNYNALWVLTLPLVLYAAASEARRLAAGRPLPGNLLGRPWFLITLAAIAVLFGLLRNIPVYPFDLLAPPG